MRGCLGEGAKKETICAVYKRKNKKPTNEHIGNSRQDGRNKIRNCPRLKGNSRQDGRNK